MSCHTKLLFIVLLQLIRSSCPSFVNSRQYHNAPPPPPRGFQPSPASASASSPFQPIPNRHQTTSRSPKDPSSHPEEDPLVSQMKRVVLSINKFSNRLQNVMNEYDVGLMAGALPSSEDFIYSPLTIFTSLATLRSGSSSDSYHELSNILSLSKVNRTVLERGMGLVLESLSRPSEKGSVHLINRLFLDHSYLPNMDFINVVKDKFYGELVQTHFSNATAASTYVNSHMYNASHGALEDVLAVEGPDAGNEVEVTEASVTNNGTNGGSSPLSSSSQSNLMIDGGLMLVSGLTLEGDWERSFTPLLTRKEPFIREDGVMTEVNMMHRDGLYYYAEIPELNATALSIPYKGYRYSFTVLLPAEGISVAEVEQNLVSFPCIAVLSRLKKAYVQLSLPRFHIETTVDLVDPLEKMGIRKVFSEVGAGMQRVVEGGDGQDLYLTNAVTKTLLEVSEGGSRVPSANFIEAVPATARYLTPYTVNRPFVFFISDQLLQTILVAGRKAL